MPPVARTALVIVVLALAAPAAALPDLSPAELQHNRELLARWKADPEHYARLRRDLAWFESLPAERRDALRRLDRDLAQEDPAAGARLWHVMDRYAAWLQRLPATDRARIDSAPDAAERLKVVREIREREWVDRLPKAKRDQLLAAPANRRGALLADLRRQERDRNAELRRPPAEPAAAQPPPTHVADLPPAVQAYVTHSLMPLLTDEDRKRLVDAEGQWPAFGRTLLELSDKHPGTLPGPPTGPVQFSQLPREVQERLEKVKGWRARTGYFEGRWPDYALAVTRVIRNQAPPMPQELGPCRAQEMPAAVQQFLDRQLLPKLGPKEKERLTAAEGRWPDYPAAVLEVARRHNLQVPGVHPPGPPEFWDGLRAAVSATGK